MSASVTRPDHDVLPERPSPERVSAVVVALALFGFFAWVVLTLPIQPALILVVAGTLAFVGWLAFSYDHPVRSRKVVATFVFGFGALWVLAGAGALYQVRIANFMLWFHALGAGLLNAVAHFVFPVLKGGYFPGLYTAVGHLVLSALLLGLLVQESRRLRARPSWSRRRPPAPARPRTSRAS
jgi:hypothetical protein